MLENLIELAKEHPIISIISICILVLIIGSSRDNKRNMERANDSWNITDSREYALRENKRRREEYHANILGWIVGVVFWGAILYGAYTIIFST